MFIDDKDKMIDFKILSKEEFLNSYSYLTEKEYDDTKKKIDNLDLRFCHLCGSVEENKYCTNKSCYEYTRHE